VAHTTTECEHLVGAGPCTTLPEITKFEMEQIELYRFQEVSNKAVDQHMIKEVAHTTIDCEHLVGTGPCTTLPEITKFEME